MKDAASNDELRPEYDLDTLGRGVTGKYQRQAAAGTNLVLLDPDVVNAVPDSNSENRALRLLIDVDASNAPAMKRRTNRSTTECPGTVAANPKCKPTGRE